MSNVNTISGDQRINGDLTVTGVIGPARPRTELAIDALVPYPIPLTQFRQHDALQTVLSNTPASDDLGIAGGTWGTNCPKITTGDLKAAGATTRRARVSFPLPPEYIAADSIRIRLSAGMETHVADVSATIDVEIYKDKRDGTISGSDLVTTAAQSINSLVFADKSFDLDESTLSPGDSLDIRISIAVNDAASATAVIGSIGAVEVLMNVRG